MNNFQSMQSGQGLLKDDYPDEPVAIRALRQRRARLTDKITVPTQQDMEAGEISNTQAD